MVKRKLSDLKPYIGNVKKHPKSQIEKIKKSILEFGFNDPIAIDENMTIIEGHGRYEACKSLGVEEVPTIMLSGMNEEQIKAYTLVHNKLTMDTGFDTKKLLAEIKTIGNIDFPKYDFNFQMFKPKEEKENGRDTTVREYNLHIYDESDTCGFYQMPTIYRDDVVPKRLIGFNYAKTSKDKEAGIHMFIDDYQFERLWNRPEDYINVLSEYDCVLTPDFSLYMNMPMAMKIWNIYRSRLLGHYWQVQGINVIPTISWAEKETFDFCFDGIEEGSIVAISTIGVKRSDEAYHIWEEGLKEMIDRIKPTKILVYGGDLQFDYPENIEVIYFQNEVTERMIATKEG